MNTAFDRHEAARHSLDQLKGELPDFEQLVEHNEAQEAELREKQRRGDATLQEIQQARGAAHIARELLEQQLADIEAAEAEVEHTEREAKAATLVDRLRNLADGMRRDQDEVHRLTRDTLEGFTHAMIQIAERHRTMTEAHASWLQLTWELRNLEGHAGQADAYDRLASAGVDVQAVQTTPGAQSINRTEASGATRQAYRAIPFRVRIPEITRHALLALRGDAIYLAPRGSLDDQELELAHALNLAGNLANAARLGALEAVETEEEPA